MVSKNYTLDPKCQKCGGPIEDHSWPTLEKKNGRFTCDVCKPGRKPIMVTHKQNLPRCTGCEDILITKQFVKGADGDYCLKCLNLALVVKE